ncbi:MAG: hypothetical protein LWW98_08990 [Deltaproteobacteria bacterium]|nr:hypothetical protein [Deltaproteobacteria bacterium]
MNINWHRLFGLLLMDYLSARGFTVELEKDLSLKRQYLDVVIIKQENKEAELSGICDGFDNLAGHNLLSYKSKREALNFWAIEELIGHYVNYRKIIGRKIVKREDIRLYAVSTRYPVKLLSGVSTKKVVKGVYEIQILSRKIRIIVLSRLPLAQRNAVLAFFSFDFESVKFALENYKWNMNDGSTVINQLLEKYSLEGIAMPYTMEQFQKDYINAHIGVLGAEEVLSKFKTEERLKGLKAEEVLSKFKAEEVLSKFKTEERLKGLKAEEIEFYLEKLKKRS